MKMQQLSISLMTPNEGRRRFLHQKKSLLTPPPLLAYVHTTFFSLMGAITISPSNVEKKNLPLFSCTEPVVCKGFFSLLLLPLDIVLGCGGRGGYIMKEKRRRQRRRRPFLSPLGCLRKKVRGRLLLNPLPDLSIKKGGGGGGKKAR